MVTYNDVRPFLGNRVLIDMLDSDEPHCGRVVIIDHESVGIETTQGPKNLKFERIATIRDEFSS